MITVETIASKLKSFLPKKRAERIGIDLRPDALRFVHARTSSSGKYILAGLGAIDIEFFKLTPEERQQLGRRLMAQCGGLSEVSFSLAHPSLRMQRMNFPPMPDGDLREAMRWNFREGIDCPIEEYRVGFLKLPRFDQKGKQAIMAFGVHAPAIPKSAEMAKQMGFKLVNLEPKASALFGLFQTNDLLKETVYTASLSMGKDESLFVVMSSELLLFSRVMPIDLTGLSDGESEASQKVLSELIIEIQRAIDAFVLMYEVEGVQELFLSGSGVPLQTMAAHVQQSLGLTTKILNPFEGWKLLHGQKENDIDFSGYDVAAGLATLSEE
ncbi:MAG: pilus assembly protein PilM [Deltaproteobacteria bacterium]|nr:pilus assembly protein PilM [Deltaproteobacteria bacterium]